MGIFFSGILIPFLGLLAMTLYKGEYCSFLGEVGKRWGFLLATMIIALIGPFGVLPRCITVSFGSVKGLFPNLSLESFSAIATLAIFFFSWKRGRILDLLGKFLTPLLLLSLFMIIACGWKHFGTFSSSNGTALQNFTRGMIEGYGTMDLLASFFFSSAVIELLKRKLQRGNVIFDPLKVSLSSSCVGMVLLSTIYFFLVLLAASFSDQLIIVPEEELLVSIAHLTLSSWGGWIFALVVALACLTTAISLTLASSDFLRKELLGRWKKISHTTSLCIILAIGFVVSTLQFSGISRFLTPIIQVIYPALIVLTLCNIIKKLYGFSHTKICFWIALFCSLCNYRLH